MKRLPLFLIIMLMAALWLHDTAAPTGQTVALSDGPWYADTSVPLELVNGSDPLSGVDGTSGVVG